MRQKKLLGKYQRSNSGMTLVEMIVTLVVFSIISTGIISMFIFAANSYAEHDRMVSNQSALRLIMNELDGSLAYAAAIGLSHEPEALRVEVDGQSISDCIQYYIEDNRFRVRDLQAGQERIIPSSADQIEMKVYSEGKNIRIELTADKYTLSQSIYCANLRGSITETFSSGSSESGAFTHIAYILPPS